MMASDAAQWIGLCVALIGVVVALLGYVSVQSKNLREVISKGDEAVASTAAKSRHDLANQVQLVTNQLRTDVETLKRESVRKEELSALDTRWSQTITRLESKMDRMSEQLGKVGALEASVKGLSDQMTAIMTRLDGRGHA